MFLQNFWKIKTKKYNFNLLFLLPGIHFLSPFMTDFFHLRLFDIIVSIFSKVFHANTTFRPIPFDIPFFPNPPAQLEKWGFQDSPFSFWSSPSLQHPSMAASRASSPHQSQSAVTFVRSSTFFRNTVWPRSILRGKLCIGRALSHSHIWKWEFEEMNFQ